MLLHIVRHGQTHWNVERRIQGHLDSELDETGFEQARKRGKDFADTQFSAVYSSSSLRTRQTTEKLLGKRMASGKVDQKYSVLYMDELREVCLGVWEGKLWNNIEAKYPDMVEAHRKATDDFSVEGAESMHQTQKRGVNAIESIIKTQKDATQSHNYAEVLIVSHGAIMKYILAYYLSIPLTTLHALPSLPNCAHCIIDVQEQQRKVIQIAGVPVEETQWIDFCTK